MTIIFTLLTCIVLLLTAIVALLHKLLGVSHRIINIAKSCDYELMDIECNTDHISGCIIADRARNDYMLGLINKTERDSIIDKLDEAKT